MNAALASVIALVALVLLMNFILLIYRLKRDSVRKPSKLALQEEQAAIYRENEIRRRLDREQADAVYRVEMRNKTLALYEEVRRRAAEREKNQGTGDRAQGTEDEP